MARRVGAEGVRQGQRSQREGVSSPACKDVASLATRKRQGDCMSGDPLWLGMDTAHDGTAFGGASGLGDDELPNEMTCPTVAVSAAPPSITIRSLVLLAVLFYGLRGYVLTATAAAGIMCLSPAHLSFGRPHTGPVTCKSGHTSCWHGVGPKELGVKLAWGFRASWTLVGTCT